jgi:hypothetical protein
MPSRPSKPIVPLGCLGRSLGKRVAVELVTEGRAEDDVPVWVVHRGVRSRTHRSCGARHGGLAEADAAIVGGNAGVEQNGEAAVF